MNQGLSKEEAFRQSTESITGPISKTISHKGILAVYEGLDKKGKAEFEQAYKAVYPAAREIIAEIYAEVSSGNEIRSVNLAGQRLSRFPMLRRVPVGGRFPKLLRTLFRCSHRSGAKPMSSWRSRFTPRTRCGLGSIAFCLPGPPPIQRCCT